MRVVFLGTPDFAVPSLRALLEGSYDICAVFCQPDKPAGRGHKTQSPPVKLLAEHSGVPVFQPEKIRALENQPILAALEPDFIVVVAYGQILPSWLLQAAGIAPVNVHASLLPAYRGAAPITWALLNGEKTTGVTTMIIQETLDTGPILLRKEVEISCSMNRGELSALLAQEGAALLIRTLDALRNNTITPVPQEAAYATWAPSITKEMAEISWEQPSAAIHNKVRAFNPWPVAFTRHKEIRVQIFRAALAEYPQDPVRPAGTYLGRTEKGMIVQCGAGTCLEILELQPASRKRISGREFAAGNRMIPNQPLFPPSK